MLTADSLVQGGFMSRILKEDHSPNACTSQSPCRSVMHLKTQLVRSDLRLDAAAVQNPRHRSLLVSQQGELLQTLGGSHGAGAKRLPVDFISAKRFCSSSNGVKPSAPLWIFPSPPGADKDRFQRTQTDSDAAQNMWTVIKPGHVREKIAIFAAEERQSGVGINEHATAAGSCDRVLTACTNGAAVTTLSRGAKVTSSWEESGSAKRCPRSGETQQNQRVLDPDEQRPARRDGEEDGDQQKLSVVEMVAFLERRTSEQQNVKPLLVLQRSSTTITLSRLAPPEVRGEEPESVRVSEMVAKLESECLRKVGGGVLRSSSLRRTVGRVLLAAATDQPPSLTSPSTLQKSTTHPSAAEATPPSAHLTTPISGDSSITQTVAPPPHADQTEPLPGLLFLSLPSDGKAPPTPSEPRPSLYKSSFYLAPAQTCPAPANFNSKSEKRRRESDCDQGEEPVISAAARSTAVPLSRTPSASRDFLVARQRLQRLLAPQPYLLLLPHHLLVKIFLLLPTRSLAALKCSCSYFKFAIENYGIRPADSLWVSDPRYRDDPCKQCKRRYDPGDVSLCRWHHKPFCQALPYGPGYWMCCHGARRDSPGCNVGLHDNRWVPAFHSINVPIYRRSCNHDN
ncbi:hypothetical protein OJAV_G00218460 [Oryzias javanicus]|uniref:F-box domain-containing protein n=1 Tax=Oryzias javanicus TaxID=123683 RepID=A0A3S2P5C8_ORYJA|nr:hypothetical protein OJAV_G00218460 [Oryzias javanicus]